MENAHGVTPVGVVSNLRPEAGVEFDAASEGQLKVLMWLRNTAGCTNEKGSGSGWIINVGTEQCPCTEQLGCGLVETALQYCTIICLETILLRYR